MDIKITLHLLLKMELSSLTLLSPFFYLFLPFSRLKRKIYQVDKTHFYSLQDETKKLQQKVEVLCGLTQKAVSFAAFYGDCLHSVEKVRAGVR